MWECKNMSCHNNYFIARYIYLSTLDLSLSRCWGLALATINCCNFPISLSDAHFNQNQNWSTSHVTFLWQVCYICTMNLNPTLDIELLWIITTLTFILSLKRARCCFKLIFCCCVLLLLLYWWLVDPEQREGSECS